MEKKGSRSVQPSPKGAATDVKKNQDANGKLWPRGSRRREPTGGSFPAKNETSRKPNTQQRNKPLFNKQPRARGYFVGANGRREETGLIECEPEVGSVIAQGSKKQSLNHLLNFQLAPHVGQNSSSGNAVFRPGHKWNSSTKHKYNKEQFIQANCQFIVKSSGDYRLYLSNPDALVDWDLIEQVNVRVVEIPSCPICLYPPVAAKITRCGHIYCWSCVLHYLALSEKTWGKCPICYEAIHKQDLKSVVTVLFSQYNIDETVTFKLMKKMRGSLIAYPVDDTVPQQDVPFNMSDTNANIYCKLLSANRADVLNIIERERLELNVQLLDDDSGSEKCFIEQAIAQLAERENFVIGQIEAGQLEEAMQAKALELKTQLAEASNQQTQVQYLQDGVQHLHAEDQLEARDAESINAQHFAGPNLNQIKNKEFRNSISNSDNGTFDNDNNLIEKSCDRIRQLGIDEDYRRQRFESTSSETGSSASDMRNCEVFDATSSAVAQHQPSKYFYFYQASDGQHIYLHTVNAKMLEHTYGSLEFCPKTISGRIIEKEVLSMSEEIRKRNRYLQHLPVTCQFELVEIHMNQNTVSRETLYYFRDQLHQRQKRRQRRVREEKRREKRITEEENQKMGKFPAANIHLESYAQFPTFNEEFAPIQRSDEEYAEQFPIYEEGDFTAQPGSSAESVYSGPSFAKMLSSASAKKQDPVWPKPKPATEAPEMVKLINVTGSHLRTSYRNVRRASDSEPECEDYVPAPTFSRSLRDDLEVALQRVNSTNSGDNEGEVKIQGGKKKKKNKQKVLFSTHMPYAS